jgi:hypothetical protein
MRVIDLNHLTRSLETYRSWLNFMQNTHAGLRQSPDDRDRDQVGSTKPWPISECIFTVKRRFLPRIYEISPVKTKKKKTNITSITIVTAYVQCCGSIQSTRCCRRVSYHRAQKQSTTRNERQSLTEPRVIVQWKDRRESRLASRVILSRFDGTNHERPKICVKTDYNERSISR